MAKEKCQNCNASATNLLMLKGNLVKHRCNKCSTSFCSQCKKGSHSCSKCGSFNTKRDGYISG